MLKPDFENIIPSPPPPVASDVITTHLLAREFNHEVYQRQAFQDYCHWYRETAHQTQREHEKLKRDFNFLAWFRR